MTDLIKRLREPLEWEMRKADEYYNDERSEAADALERMQWNPDMDAAPKDGTDVLVHVEKTREQFVAFYNSGRWAFGLMANGHAIALRDPTHWMPLPTPPEGE